MKIKGTVWEPVQATPRSAAFGRLAANVVGTSKSVKKITITNNVKGELKLANIKCSNPAFDFELKEIEPGQKAELTIKVVGTLKPGLNRANFEMTTGVADMPKLKITASAHLTPEVEVQPKQITVYPDRKTTRPYTVIVRNNGKAPLKVSDATVNSAELKVKLIEKKQGKMFSISVNIPNEFKLTGKEKITFKTDNAMFPKLTVPIVERKTGSRTAGKKNRTKQVSEAKALDGDYIKRRKQAATASKNGKDTQKGAGVSARQSTSGKRASGASNTGKMKKIHGTKKVAEFVSPTANRNGAATEPEAEAEPKADGEKTKANGEKVKKEEATSGSNPKK